MMIKVTEYSICNDRYLTADIKINKHRFYMFDFFQDTINANESKTHTHTDRELGKPMAIDNTADLLHNVHL